MFKTARNDPTSKIESFNTASLVATTPISCTQELTARVRLSQWETAEFKENMLQAVDSNIEFPNPGFEYRIPKPRVRT